MEWIALLLIIIALWQVLPVRRVEVNPYADSVHALLREENALRRQQKIDTIVAETIALKRIQEDGK